MLIIVLISLGAGAMLEHLAFKHPELSLKKDEELQQQNNVVTIIKEHKNANGSEDRQTTIVDHSKKSESSKEELVTNKVPDWMLYGTATIDRTYGLGVQRRILGNLFIGAFADSERRLGVSLGILF